MNTLFTILFSFIAFPMINACANITTNNVTRETLVTETCIKFTNLGNQNCLWMCNYCQQKLVSNDIYFKDNVCIPQGTSCIGNPVQGKIYTCCIL